MSANSLAVAGTVGAALLGAQFRKWIQQRAMVTAYDIATSPTAPLTWTSEAQYLSHWAVVGIYVLGVVHGLMLAAICVCLPALDCALLLVRCPAMFKLMRR